MFTGIVETTGRIAGERQSGGGSLRVRIEPDQMWSDLTLGESISVSGACLTVVAWDAASFEVELTPETVAKTAQRWTEGATLNLERAMPANGRFGGHFVSGHVDGVARVMELKQMSGAAQARIEAPRSLARYLVPKGSVTLDGVSLTVVDVGATSVPAAVGGDVVETEEFTVWLVPHTLTSTTLGGWRKGDEINLEADQLAKYVERLLAVRERDQEAVP